MRSIAPGIPNIPTINAFIIFNPMWKLNSPPIKFIINIKSPPSAEFRTNFNIIFIGAVNSFPNINMNDIHAKNAIIVLSSKLITST